jgi:hypothetical protein
MWMATGHTDMRKADSRIGLFLRPERIDCPPFDQLVGQWSDSEVRRSLRHVRMRTSESRTTSNCMILVPL